MNGIKQLSFIAPERIPGYKYQSEHRQAYRYQHFRTRQIELPEHQAHHRQKTEDGPQDVHVSFVQGVENNQGGCKQEEAENQDVITVDNVMDQE